MKRRKIVTLPIADEDITQAYENILNDRPSAVLNFLDEIEHTFGLLEKLPYW